MLGPLGFVQERLLAAVRQPLLEVLSKRALERLPPTAAQKTTADAAADAKQAADSAAVDAAAREAAAFTAAAAAALVANPDWEGRIDGLLVRFPSAGRQEALEALHEHSGHAGKAGKALEANAAARVAKVASPQAPLQLVAGEARGPDEGAERPSGGAVVGPQAEAADLMSWLYTVLQPALAGCGWLAAGVEAGPEG